MLFLMDWDNEGQNLDFQNLFKGGQANRIWEIVDFHFFFLKSFSPLLSEIIYNVCQFLRPSTPSSEGCFSSGSCTQINTEVARGGSSEKWDFTFISGTLGLWGVVMDELTFWLASEEQDLWFADFGPMISSLKQNEPMVNLDPEVREQYKFWRITCNVVHRWAWKIGREVGILSSVWVGDVDVLSKDLWHTYLKPLRTSLWGRFQMPGI